MALIPLVVTKDKKAIVIVNEKELQRILSKHWKKEIKLSSAVPEPATAVGNNFVSDAWRIRLQYTEEGKNETFTTTVVVKSKPDDDDHNIMMNTDSAFKNEILAYEKVLPALNKYVCTPLRIPEYISGDALSILLEDLRNSSFQELNKKLATEWNQVWSPIQEMAKLHAASLVMQKLDYESFQKLVDQIDQVPYDKTALLGDKQTTSIDTIVEVLNECNPPNVDLYRSVVTSLKPESWQKQKNIIEEKVKIRVINHGTIWINNLVYRNDMITLMDWQHIVYSSPATDLSFFLYVNLDTDFLCSKRRKLIDFYLLHLHQNIYDKLLSHNISISEIDAVLSDLTIDWIESELKRCSLHGFMMAQWTTPVYYWSEAVFIQLQAQGGMENIDVAKRLTYMTSEQKERVIKLTKYFINESK